MTDRFGSLEAGKVANVIVTTGDMLEVRTDTKYLFIDGRPLPLETQHATLSMTHKDRKSQFRRRHRLQHQRCRWRPLNASEEPAYSYPRRCSTLRTDHHPTAMTSRHAAASASVAGAHGSRSAYSGEDALPCRQLHREQTRVSPSSGR